MALKSTKRYSRALNDTVFDKYRISTKYYKKPPPGGQKRHLGAEGRSRTGTWGNHA